MLVVPVAEYAVTSALPAAARDPVEVDVQRSTLHRLPQTDVVPVVWVSTSVSVLKKTIRAEAVAVWSLRGGPDRDGYLKRFRFEDALLAYQRDALVPQLKTPGQQRPGEHIAADLDLSR